MSCLVPAKTAITSRKAAISSWVAAVSARLAAKPWTHWVIAILTIQLFFFVDRCVGLDALVRLYGDDSDVQSSSVKVAVLALGAVEDFVCALYFVFVLWLGDAALSRLTRRGGRFVTAAKTIRFFWYLIVFIAVAVPFATNVLLVRRRQFRFTFSLIKMALKEKDNASAASISPSQLHEMYATISATLSVALLFAVVGALWLDLYAWNPFAFTKRGSYTTVPCETAKSADETNEAEEKDASKMEEGESDGICSTTSDEDAESSSPTSSRADSTKTDTTEKPTSPKTKRALLANTLSKLRRHLSWPQLFTYAICVACCLIIFPIILLEIITHWMSPLIADSALNTTLNELYNGVAGESFMPDLVDESLGSPHLYIDTDSEIFKLVSNDSLYRTTLGFKGDLAFNVSVDNDDPPNVLVLVVESFRYHDSQYLVANNTYLLKDQNITVTPNFDRWAKRGVAFHNFWSSWRTSRSVESILFGQVPYDSVSDSGTTGGRKDVKLAGMPQLFTSKGYSTKFTTGCILNYDGWDTFFGAHGFDEVLGNNEFRKLAERDLGISPNDWALVSRGGKSRAMRHWGVHDDVALPILGNILVNETAAQRERVAKGEPKRPLFINHYTISSHTPFQDRPEWYDKATKPDFSALYKDEKYAKAVQNYLEMRYFTDMAIGKFLDDMEEKGVLNDTIVLIMGDHGQGPENGLDVPESRELSATRVAATLIAEGRLGKYAGMMVTDVAEQYDFLNTLADIVGVPEGGFEQDGVGRSLKRAPITKKQRERVVYSNNPSRKLSVVRGNERLEFDASSTAMALHNAETDHDLKHDLFPALSDSEKRKWRKLSDRGRWLDGYYKKRWDEKCLLAGTCP